MDQSVQQAPRVGGVCAIHGVYDGRRCRECAKTRALAALRQAAWEAMQFLTDGEVREFVEGVLREVESDASGGEVV